MNRKFLRPEEQLLKIGSSGRPIWGAEVEVVNDQHDPLSMGQEGEIRVRGPNVCQGYYKNPEEQKKRFIDGWYYTGDIGRFDDDGYLYVVGRMKDIIKTGSINVRPRKWKKCCCFIPTWRTLPSSVLRILNGENRFRRTSYCAGNMRSTRGD